MVTRVPSSSSLTPLIRFLRLSFAARASWRVRAAFLAARLSGVSSSMARLCGGMVEEDPTDADERDATGAAITDEAVGKVAADEEPPGTLGIDKTGRDVGNKGFSARGGGCGVDSGSELVGARTGDGSSGNSEGVKGVSTPEGHLVGSVIGMWSWIE